MDVAASASHDPAWSKSPTAVVGTESCQAPHTGYIISGRLHS